MVCTLTLFQTKIAENYYPVCLHAACPHIALQFYIGKYIVPHSNYANYNNLLHSKCKNIYTYFKKRCRVQSNKRQAKTEVNAGYVLIII